MKPDPTPDAEFEIQGGVNFLLLGGILLAVLASGSFRLGTITLSGIDLEIQNLLRDPGVRLISLPRDKLQQNRPPSGWHRQSSHHRYRAETTS